MTGTGISWPVFLSWSPEKRLALARQDSRKAPNVICRGASMRCSCVYESCDKESCKVRRLRAEGTEFYERRNRVPSAFPLVRVWSNGCKDISGYKRAPFTCKCKSPLSPFPPPPAPQGNIASSATSVMADNLRSTVEFHFARKMSVQLVLAWTGCTSCRLGGIPLDDACICVRQSRSLISRCGVAYQTK